MYAQKLPRPVGSEGHLAGKIRLICFASTPGDQVQFRRWATQLDDHIELLAVDTPVSALMTQAEALQALIERLSIYLNVPHALFAQGASGPVAYQVARAAERRFPGQTQHLFVSNCNAPAPSDAPLNVALTALYPAGALPEFRCWRDFSHRELELIEVPEPLPGDPHGQRLVQIINTHLGLLSL
ncbi:thioesterase [Pseudomonas fontis]|uniref:Thioesterase n=1 Tax=Pseudomonas fontis TaxID=2942633 RepID=A0ABT5NK60_9PSED|nr:thioesterase [Pseudomonas fontis]MDD0977359.1 thioesterase [Pseudomonas fontis]MDD0988924.1 thioesterase [Pseudomonas fontis]